MSDLQSLRNNMQRILVVHFNPSYKNDLHQDYPITNTIEIIQNINYVITVEGCWLVWKSRDQDRIYSLCFPPKCSYHLSFLYNNQVCEEVDGCNHPRLLTLTKREETQLLYKCYFLHDIDGGLIIYCIRQHKQKVLPDGKQWMGACQQVFQGSIPVN